MCWILGSQRWIWTSISKMSRTRSKTQSRSFMKVCLHSTTVRCHSQNSIIGSLSLLRRCQTVTGTRASGVRQQGSEMALVIASLQKQIRSTKDIGMKAHNTEKAGFYLWMVTTRVILWPIRGMVQVSMFGTWVTGTKVTGLTVRRVVLANCFL